MSSRSETIGFLLSDTYRLYRRQFEAALSQSDLGLTAGAARALAFACAFNGVRQNHLAERMAVEPMTLVGYLDTLEGLGLITRNPDPTDRRCKVITTTELAEARVEKIREIGAGVREKAMQGMSDEEIEAFRRTLIRMRDHLCEARAAQGGGDDAAGAGGQAPSVKLQEKN